MREDLTPTQRKQAHRNTKRVSSLLSSENQPVSTHVEEELTGDPFWDKWAAEAYRQTRTKNGWDSFMAEKALEEIQKIDPTVVHVKYAGRPMPYNEELRNRMLEEMRIHFPEESESDSE